MATVGEYKESMLIMEDYDFLARIWQGESLN
jgi:hypothetical protein